MGHYLNVSVISFKFSKNRTALYLQRSHVNDKGIETSARSDLFTTCSRNKTFGKIALKLTD